MPSATAEVHQTETLQEATTSKVENNIDEEPSQSKNIYDQVFNVAGKIAATNFGQYAIEKVDKVLSVFEKTAKWSLPQTEHVGNNNATGDATGDDKNAVQEPDTPLERPCSWLPFLTLIIALRIVRVGLSFGALLIGNKPITPASMVYFIQQRRRKLRAVKYHGLRALRMKKQSSDERKKRGVIGKLSLIFNRVICRPGRFQDTPAHLVVVKKIENSKENHHVSSNKEVLNSNQKRPLDDEYETDEDLPVDKLLDKYGNEGSDADDSDFVPDLKSEESLSSESEFSDDNEELVKRLNELKNQEDETSEHVKENSSNAATMQSTNGTNSIQEENKHENFKKIVEQSDAVDSELEQTPIVAEESPKIAQNGNVLEDEKIENFYDTIDGCADANHQRQHHKGLYTQQTLSTTTITDDDSYYSPIGSPNFIENNIEIQMQIQQAEPSKVAVTDDSTGKVTENHVEAQNSHQSQQNNSNKHNNKKHYNNIYYKYHNKGKRAH